MWYVMGGLLYLVAGVAFLCWLFRARANAYAISPGVFHTYPTSYLILGWIPFLCLFVPKGIVDDIWATSRPGGLWPGTDLLRVRPRGRGTPDRPGRSRTAPTGRISRSSPCSCATTTRPSPSTPGASGSTSWRTGSWTTASAG
ncbi:DUF4328 domain-containing protein [Streptosporangium longisporum]